MFKKDNINFEDDSLIDISGVASATECTGLIQIPPQNEEEAESYNEIYTVPKEKYTMPDEKTKSS